MASAISGYRGTRSVAFARAHRPTKGVFHMLPIRRPNSVRWDVTTLSTVAASFGGQRYATAVGAPARTRLRSLVTSWRYTLSLGVSGVLGPIRGPTGASRVQYAGHGFSIERSWVFRPRSTR